MRSLLAALQFLTVLPVPARLDESDFGRAPYWFPAAGLVVGWLAGTGCVVLEWMGIQGPLLPILTVAMLAAWSGGLHLDGLADMADGFLSARPKERVMEIMRDSRIGTMGVLALFLVLAVKVFALGGLTEPMRGRMLLLAPLLGRASLVIAMRVLPYARASGEGGLATVFSRNRPISMTLVAVLSMVGGAILLLGLRGGVVCLASTGLAILFIAWWSWRRIGGFTGDTLGATSEVVEAVVLTTACAMGSPGSVGT